MSGSNDVVPGLLRHAPRPQTRLDLYGSLAAVTVAVVAYVAALSLRILPPPGFAVVLFAAAPLLAAVALPIVAVRARVTGDSAVAWFGTGLGVALVAMILQLISFPAVVPDGGPLGTDTTGNAQLYLVYHAFPALAVLAACAGVADRWRAWFLVVGSGIAAACALNLVPSPELIAPDLRFTRVLVVSEVVIAVVLAAAAVQWIRRFGRSASALQVWIGVALSLCCYDVVLNAVAAERFQPIWWASLSLRVATYAVLAFGAVGVMLVDLHRLEHYTDAELDRSDQALQASVSVTDRLLASAEALARAATLADVAQVLMEACRVATGLPRAAVIVLDPETGHLRTVASFGYDEETRQRLADYSLDEPLPSAAVVRRRSPLFYPTKDQLAADFPAIAGLAAHARTQRLAVLPLLSAGSAIGVVTVSGDQPGRWTTTEREVLAGLAAQAGQAVQRAILFERHRATAEQLQHGLLPQRLAYVPGLQTAARYEPGAAGLEVGGDWYDCLPLADGRVVLVVGDVMGKGVAAAARMGQVRHAIRVLATMDPSPSAVLTGLDQLPEDGTEDQLVTLTYLLLDPRTGQAILARAGHLPPAVVPSQGPATLLEGGGSPPLGVLVERRQQERLVLPPDATLIMFTDGLVEDRRTGLDVGLPRLLEVAGRLRAEEMSVPDLADRLMRECGQADGRRDDRCLLVARLVPATGDAG